MAALSERQQARIDAITNRHLKTLDSAKERNKNPECRNINRKTEYHERYMKYKRINCRKTY